MAKTIHYRDRRTNERFSCEDASPHFTVFHYAENSLRDDGNRSLDIYRDTPEKQVDFCWDRNVIVIEAIVDEDGQVIYNDPGCSRDRDGSPVDIEDARYQGAVVAVLGLTNSIAYSDTNIDEAIAQIRYSIGLLETCPRYSEEMPHCHDALQAVMVLTRLEGPSSIELKRIRDIERLFTNKMCRIEGKAEDSMCECQDMCDC